jgi:hypothetical protein
MIYWNVRAPEFSGCEIQAGRSRDPGNFMENAQFSRLEVRKGDSRRGYCIQQKDASCREGVEAYSK